MGFEITVYRAVRMKAQAFHSMGSNWVDVIVFEPARGRYTPASENTMTIHFDGDDAARKATAYANAINATDKEFHPAEVAKELADA